MIEKSIFFHQRATLAKVELAKSPIKIISADLLSTYNRTLAFTFTSITKLLLTYLSIPLMQMSDFP